MYCFKDLNHETFGWDLDREATTAGLRLQALGSEPNVFQARAVLGRFYDSMRDIHVRPIYNTSSPYTLTRLPFTIRSVSEGQKRSYLITSIDRTLLPEANFSFQVSDELISIGGKPVQAWVNEYLPAVYAQPASQQAFAERYALAHYDFLGKSMPTGTVRIEVKHADGKVEAYFLNWVTTAKTSFAAEKFRAEEARTAGRGSLIQHDDEIDGGLTATSTNLKNYATVGAKAPFFSDLGEVTWHSGDQDFYYAYIAKLPNGKKIGFVRVPTYFPNQIYDVATPAFYALVDRFVDAQISLLIFDQTNNGGGSLLYTYDLMKALIDQPMAAKMTTEWIVNETHFELSQPWAKIREVAIKAKTDQAAFDDFQKNYFIDKIVDQEFLDGVIAQSDMMLKNVADPHHARLAKAYPFEGVSVIRPKAGKHYTGPILMLNNELSISAGDLTPALFFSMKRAKFFGTLPGGAGAYQNGFLSPEKNPFELYYNSISFGKFNYGSGLAVEGNPVRPDFHYEVTRYDLTHDMNGYRQALLVSAQAMTR